MRAPAEIERRVGTRRIIRAGDVVKFAGIRGSFVVCAFHGDEVDVYGGTPNRERSRTFPVSSMARRLRKPERRAS